MKKVKYKVCPTCRSPFAVASAPHRITDLARIYLRIYIGRPLARALFGDFYIPRSSYRLSFHSFFRTKFLFLREKRERERKRRAFRELLSILFLPSRLTPLSRVSSYIPPAVWLVSLFPLSFSLTRLLFFPRKDGTGERQEKRDGSLFFAGEKYPETSRNSARTRTVNAIYVRVRCFLSCGGRGWVTVPQCSGKGLSKENQKK